MLTFGKLPGLDPSIDPTASKPSSGPQKVELLKSLLETHKDDEYLCQAYNAKLQSLSGIGAVMSSQEKIQEVMDKTTKFLDEVEEQLKTGPFSKGGWLASAQPSIADFMWAVIINRFQWKGLSDMWLTSRPNVTEYVTKFKALPVWKEAVVDYLN